MKYKWTDDVGNRFLQENGVVYIQTKDVQKHLDKVIKIMKGKKEEKI